MQKRWRFLNVQKDTWEEEHMQAITVSIGQTGINYFMKELVIDDLVFALARARPGDRRFSVPPFGSGPSNYTDIIITLTNGSLVNFQPAFQSLVQQPDGQLLLTLAATSFFANYQWEEAYNVTTTVSGHDSTSSSSNHEDRAFSSCSSRPRWPSSRAMSRCSLESSSNPEQRWSLFRDSPDGGDGDRLRIVALPVASVMLSPSPSVPRCLSGEYERASSAERASRERRRL